MNARNTHAALEQIRTDKNVEVSHSAPDGWDYTATVYAGATTYAPALDPVQVWADHNPEFTVEKIISDVGGDHVYAIKLPN